MYKKKKKKKKKKDTNLLYFLVLLLLPFLLLCFCLIIHQRLVPLWQKRKMDFSVAVLSLSAVAGSRVMQTLLLIHAVHMPLVVRRSYVQSFGCCWISVEQHWWERFRLHVARLLQLLRIYQKVPLSPQRVRYVVNSGYCAWVEVHSSGPPCAQDLAQSP